MSQYEDEDGIDGPFERAIRKAIKADRGAIEGQKAPRRDDPVVHSRAGENSTGRRPSPVEQSPSYRASMRDAGRGHLLP